MNVTKEFLEHLNLESMTLVLHGKNIILVLRQCIKNIWTLNCAEQIETGIYNVQFVFKIDTEYITEILEVKVTESGENYCIMTVPLSSESKYVNILMTELKNLEYIDEKYGRRKELRITVGKTKSMEFGLSGIEQQVYFKSIKVIQPCAIVDVSLHGICIITPFNAMDKDSTIYIKLSFIDPNLTVMLEAHKVHTRLQRVNSITYATISCQILEPIHYEWKNRIAKFTDKTIFSS